MSELAALIDRHCHFPISQTPIPGLLLTRSDVPTRMEMAVPPPLFCVIASGRKRVMLGNDEFTYDAETYLITSADLPISGQVLEAPMLGLNLELDAGLLAELIVEMRPGERSPKAMAVSVLDGDLRDSVTRLLRLLDTPGHIGALSPLILREIYFRLLLGPKREMLRQLALPTSQLSQINRAIGYLRRCFDQPILVEELAELAGMSVPSFHRHFRATTGMSPIQFQKRLRLQTARRRLLSENQGAASVALEVGYESASQFSREYRRMFGAPPAQDTRRARELASIE